MSTPKYSLNDGQIEGKALTYAETKHKTIFLHGEACIDGPHTAL